jgi:predicted enzyme related to lactoylglutathione lyase
LLQAKSEHRRAKPPGGVRVKLGAVRIFVLDIVEARRFYSEKLGLSVEACDEEHGFCMFDTGATKLIVEAIDSNEDKKHRALVGRFTGLSFPVLDIQTKHRQLVGAGVEFSGAPELQYWGGWLATFKDPAGNALQLVQQPVQEKAVGDAGNQVI